MGEGQRPALQLESARAHQLQPRAPVLSEPFASTATHTQCMKKKSHHTMSF